MRDMVYQKGPAVVFCQHRLTGILESNLPLIDPAGSSTIKYFEALSLRSSDTSFPEGNACSFNGPT